MKKGQSYGYTKIKEFAEDNDFTQTDIGDSVVGEDFIVLKHNEKDQTISFVLTGSSGTGYIYECIYAD
jgi:hypothetical protein